MNPKIPKLRSEREKSKAKIAELQARVRDFDKQIRELENIDIIGLVRERGLTLEAFASIMAGTPPEAEEFQPEASEDAEI